MDALSPLVDSLPDNAAMPRCGPGVTSSCYAGTNAGRGDAPGLFFVEADSVTVRELIGVEPSPRWVQRTGFVFDAGACGAGPDCPDTSPKKCIYSQLAAGSCCTSPTSANFCLR